ncbi:MAG: hypothetical protein A2Y03_06615 [Omnitrophica WOR_2 bacterium GWF2_38_59]|nr:MAG: hypothetical protein A2Y03_06615 [Omnitrophica WOR_2 bacterium GWF2_38_59]OGX50477.1 MAG: hypothetical protein A2243_01960 [Omnitrophica WOR_2 bacterium RIFOXYA2_FULL_38_17]OGX51560.1 MAG: hypothetical protein A2267_08810 [Omnitrophica WOR_2 bacterium RIFOXYA12_FULL_38_10]OGX59486.1 MAG: hypothetical protein A2306_09585 [Omnitrophica WOR_2 bacterium RIFOXYB2_FULL_38_16]
MKNTNIALSLVLVIFLNQQLSEARSGCCSHHSGVCGCLCCDGSPLSSTCAPYYPYCSTSSKIVPKLDYQKKNIFPNNVYSTTNVKISELIDDVGIFEDKTNKELYRVERVIDGDTLLLTSGERVRLIGIDTPESKPNDKAKRDATREGKDIETITKMGKEAAEFVKALIKPGDEVRIEFDVQDRDKYGRLLAYVYKLICLNDCQIYFVKDEYSKLDDGWYEFINATIIKEGYASPMTIPPNVKYADLFKELYKEARENNRGLWREE